MLIPALLIAASIAASVGMSAYIGDPVGDAQMEVDLKGQQVQKDFIQSRVIDQRSQERADERFGGMQRDIQRNLQYDAGTPRAPDPFMDQMMGKLGMSVSELRRRTDPSRIGDYTEMESAVRGAANG